MNLKTKLTTLGLYIHIPWCLKKCPYCDFNSHAVKGGAPESSYIDALLADFAASLERYQLNRQIGTVFIGGGTPSLFSAEALNRLLRGIERLAPLRDDAEITLEANPGTFDSGKFSEYKSLGINRLSIGIQSFNDALLQKLGRVHSAAEAVAAVEIAHHAGFDNLNLDLMFGLPGAAAESSENDIETAIRLNPSHISFYQLTLEPNTYFHKYPPKLPDDETIFETQKRCQQLLADHGYLQYEISAYSKDGRQCRHNLNYWRFGDYLGIGAGAHGKITFELPGRIIRTAKPRSPEVYLSNPDSTGVETVISIEELPLEFAMNHLRLKQGFAEEDYRSATGLPIDTLEPGLSDNLKQALLLSRHNHYYCSERGWNFLDSILQKFIP
ncbi:MAG: radical SAM family heme chaperone HemW [Gammaproteobacteria bacterium]